MQKKVQIVSDGSLDLPQEITDAHDIEVVPFYVCKKCKGKYSGDLHLYYDKIQWLPAICNGCKRDGKGRISRSQDHSY